MERRRERPRTLTRKQMLGWANYLTYARIAVAPVMVALLYFIDPSRDPSRWNVFFSWVAAILFAVTGITDIVDGYLARRREGSGTSSFGQFIDPLADKLVMAAVLIMLIPLGRLWAWIVILLISREIVVTAVRAMAAGEGIVIAASLWGKRKTAIEICGLTALLIHYPFWGVNPRTVGLVLIALTVIASIGSGAHYIWSFFSEILAREKQKTS